MTIRIHNLPDYYTKYQYIVARLCDDEWWFWGCYNDHDDAIETADIIHGAWFHNEDWIGN